MMIACMSFSLRFFSSDLFKMVPNGCASLPPPQNDHQQADEDADQTGEGRNQRAVLLSHKRKISERSFFSARMADSNFTIPSSVKQ
jgi:hypothetical protein